MPDDAETSGSAVKPKLPSRARELLRDARWSLVHELESAGEDDEKGDPHLQGQRRLLNKIDRYLKANPARRR